MSVHVYRPLFWWFCITAKYKTYLWTLLKNSLVVAICYSSTSYIAITDADTFYSTLSTGPLRMMKLLSNCSKRSIMGLYFFLPNYTCFCLAFNCTLLIKKKKKPILKSFANFLIFLLLLLFKVLELFILRLGYKMNWLLINSNIKKTS